MSAWPTGAGGGSVTYTSRPRPAIFSSVAIASEWRMSWVRIGLPSSAGARASRQVPRRRLPMATLLRWLPGSLPGKSHRHESPPGTCASTYSPRPAARLSLTGTMRDRSPLAWATQGERSLRWRSPTAGAAASPAPVPARQGDLRRHRRPAQRLSLGDLDCAGHLALAGDARDELAPGSHLPRGRYVCPDPDAVGAGAELARHDEAALARRVGFPLAPGGNGLGPLHVDDLGDGGRRVREAGHVPQPSLRAFRHREAQVLAEGDVASHERGVLSRELDPHRHDGTSRASGRSDSTSIDR